MYTTNVEGICRRFVEERRAKLQASREMNADGCMPARVGISIREILGKSSAAAASLWGCRLISWREVGGVAE